jgi:hypothetical protein
MSGKQEKKETLGVNTSSARSIDVRSQNYFVAEAEDSWRRRESSVEIDRGSSAGKDSTDIIVMRPESAKTSSLSQETETRTSTSRSRVGTAQDSSFGSSGYGEDTAAKANMARNGMNIHTGTGIDDRGRKSFRSNSYFEIGTMDGDVSGGKGKVVDKSLPPLPDERRHRGSKSWLRNSGSTGEGIALEDR